MPSFVPILIHIIANMAEKSNGKGRTRNFATVVYPDSAPEHWMDILNEFHVPAFISPLHYADINPDGETKKAHWHVLLMFDGVKTDDQAKEIFDSINGVGLERVSTLRGYARYLCHLDNPEKFQYNINDVKSLAGASYVDIIGLASDRYLAIGEMLEWCQENEIISYAELLMFSKAHRQDWFRVLCDSGTLVMKEFLKSKAWTEKQIKL